MDKTLTEELLGLAKRIAVATKRIEDATKQIADGLEGAQPKPVGVIARPGMVVCIGGTNKRRVVVSRKAFQRINGDWLPSYTSVLCVDVDGVAQWGVAAAYETLSGEPITGYEDD